jgi:rhamnogalacturonyl hydrolase YesR
LFNDWENLFLVEEYIPGRHLGHFTIGFNPLIRIHSDERVRQDYIQNLRSIWTNLASGIATIHDQGIVCGDLSITNVIVQESDPGTIRIVDLEAAWEVGVDAPTRLGTSGFVSPTQPEVRDKENDFYALGAVMLCTLFPMNSLLEVKPSAKEVFVETMGAELGIPEQVRHMVQKCMSDEASKRPMPRQVVEVIQQSPPWCAGASTSLPPSKSELLTTVGDITNYIRGSTSLDREDRLFPADPAVFFTNPLSVAYGAAGVAYALSRLEGNVPKPALFWMLSRPVTPDRYPPGLYVGSAGIAWALWEIGLEEVALQTLRTADNHPLLKANADVFYGAAGTGLTYLRFYLGTKDQEWLDRAVQLGEWLLHSKVEVDNQGCCWPDQDGQVWLSYARGASGIALYLLYLSLVTGDKRFLDTGECALAFDLAHAYTTEEGHLSIPRGTVDAFENVITHYWLDGSAGVATALLRFWASTKNSVYLDTLNRLAPDTFRKITVFPSLFRGLSGLGNFLLDAYDFTGEERYLHEAYRAASGVNLFQIQQSNGVAFPGEQLLRISTDFGTGSAGIALFLHRLAHADQHIGNFNFTLDHLLQEQDVR